MRKYTFIDLFSGCGGLSEGFLQSGRFEALAYVEWEQPMVETLRQRLVDHWGETLEEAEQHVVRFDIQRTKELIEGAWSDESRELYSASNASLVVEKGLRGIIGSREVDIIVGGPPCQAYSIAGRAQDAHCMKDDYRNYLFESFVKVVNEFRPKAFVFENVPGLLTACPGDEPVRVRIYNAFKSIGYEIRTPETLKTAVFSAADFETPQERRRIIIVGVRNDSGLRLNDFYATLNEKKGRLPKLTVRDAIGSLPKFEPLPSPTKVGRYNVSHHLVGSCSVPQHIARYHSSRDVNVFLQWLKNDMNGFTQNQKLAFYTAISGKRSNHVKYRSLSWDKPSPTIVAHLYKDGLMFIHPDATQLRSITIREAALLQSFPMDYKFVGTSAYCFKMIGNAVPVNFARNIAICVADVLDGAVCKDRKVLNVLVACEESQAVCNEFRRLGHNAFSCDLLECSGGHPEWHFNCDVFEVIRNGGGVLQNGDQAFIDGKWDLMVAHPPCTFLAVSGARWYYNPEDKDLPLAQRRPHPRFPNRAKDREDAKAFFKALANAKVDHIAIENPVGIMNTQWRKPSQTVHPWQFGDEASKTTCLWLKGLPNLKPTNVVGKGEMVVLSSGKSLPKWYSDALQAKTAAERRTLRSKTFPGFAKALAEQWSEFLLNKNNEFCLTPQRAVFSSKENDASSTESQRLIKKDFF